jgi:hypothetical protein
LEKGLRRVGVKNGNGLMAEKGRGHLALIGKSRRGPGKKEKDPTYRLSPLGP